jgi:hypothetical protein
LAKAALPFERSVPANRRYFQGRRHCARVGRLGAEILAGGSIHMYGTTRGGAAAHDSGNRLVRIFRNKIEAEPPNFYRMA